MTASAPRSTLTFMDADMTSEAEQIANDLSDRIMNTFNREFNSVASLIEDPEIALMIVLRVASAVLVIMTINAMFVANEPSTEKAAGEIIDAVRVNVLKGLKEAGRFQ